MKGPYDKELPVFYPMATTVCPQCGHHAVYQRCSSRGREYVCTQCTYRFAIKEF